MTYMEEVIKMYGLNEQAQRKFHLPHCPYKVLGKGPDKGTEECDQMQSCYDCWKGESDGQSVMEG